MQNFLSGLLNKLGFASSSQTDSQAANQTTMPEIHTQPDQPLPAVVIRFQNQLAGGQIRFARSRIGKAAVAEYTAG